MRAEHSYLCIIHTRATPTAGLGVERLNEVRRVGVSESANLASPSIIFEQEVFLRWHPVAPGEMPPESGTVLVAFSDGSVESYPISDEDIDLGVIRCGHEVGQYWAYSIPHPDFDIID